MKTRYPASGTIAGVTHTARPARYNWHGWPAWHRWSVGALLVALLLAGVSPTPLATVRAAGNTYTVYDFGDATNDAVCAGSCTLREAVNASNATPPSAGATNTIVLATNGGDTVSLSNAANFGTLVVRQNVTIAPTPGAGPVTIDGGGSVQLFSVNSGVTLGLTGLALTNGNSAGNGGAVNNNGTVNIANSTFTGNSAFTSGGALFNNNGTMNLSAVTFSGNTTTHGNGGALANGGGTVNVVNGIFNGNNASTGQGGAVATSMSTTRLTGSTFSSNSAIGGGALYNSGSAIALRLTLSVVAGNTATGSNGPDIGGAVTSLGGNVVGKTDGSTGITNGANYDKAGTATAPLNALLGPLADNGGPVQTFALQPGSPALDIVPTCPQNPVTNTTLSVDARGQTRPQGAGCDAGAYEASFTPRTYVVTRFADDASDANCTVASCTLRQAINAANFTEGGGTNTITFAASGTVALVGGTGFGTLTIAHTVTVDATVGGRAVTVTAASGNGNGLFGVNSSATLSLTGLTMTGTNIVNSNANQGGAVSLYGTLNASGCTFASNTAGLGGAIAAFPGSTLNVSGSTFTNNMATPGNGGAILNYGTATITNTTFSGNSENSQGIGNGGGVIFNFGGTLRITGSTFSGNSVTGGANGGAIDTVSGTVTLTLSVMAGNTATGGSGPNINGAVTDGGGNVIGDTTGSSGLTDMSDRLNVPALLGALGNYGGPVQTIALQPGSPALDIVPTCPAGLTTDARGVSRPQGGGCDAGAFEAIFSPYTFVVTRFADDASDANCNMAANGGCTLRQAVNAANLTTGTGTNTITFAADGTTTLANSANFGPIIPTHAATIDAAGHTVTVSGGGVGQLFRVNNGITLGLSGLTLTGGSNATGGALYVASGGTLNLSGSTVAGNTAPGGNGGAVANFGTTNIVNSSFTNDSASNGGAVFNSGTLGVTGSTFSGNSASNGSGGAVYSSGTLSLSLALVAGNMASVSGPDLFGAVTADGGGNVVGNTAGSSGITNGTNNDRAGTSAASLNALVAPLGSYGGTVQTLALLPGSPALDIAPCPNGLTTDARGVGRPQGAGGKCDAGAYESRGFTAGTLTGGGQNGNINTAFATPVGLTVSSMMGEPVTGRITFTITPGGGASATFAPAGGCTLAMSNTVAVCDAMPSGVVASPAFTANNVAGGFSIVATAYGLAAPVTFTETNVVPPLVIAPATLPATGPGSPYSQTLTATGGSGTGYSYALASGSSLPAGLTLNGATGTLSGTTPGAGSYTFTVQVTDSASHTGTQTYTLVVAVPNATPRAAATAAMSSTPPATAPPTHTPGATPSAGTPTPLPQPMRH